jgi:hypothetical protein
MRILSHIQAARRLKLSMVQRDDGKAQRCLKDGSKSLHHNIASCLLFFIIINFTLPAQAGLWAA